MPATGDPEVLYIMNKTVYIWDSETQTYMPTYHDISEQLNMLAQTVLRLTEEVEQRPTRTEVNNAINTGVNEAKQYTDSEISALSSRINSTQNQVEDVAVGLANTQESVTSLQETVADVQQESKDYTDQQAQTLVNYVNETFVLKEV